MKIRMYHLLHKDYKQIALPICISYEKGYFLQIKILVFVIIFDFHKQPH
jgi:hypothetical protein